MGGSTPYRLDLRLLLTAVAVVTAGLAGRSARAQPADPVAESLFREGRSLMEKGATAAACEKFAASDRAAPSVGARINLGDCYRLEGKTASAWATYQAAAGLARQLGDDRRIQLIKELAAQTEADLVYLLIRVEGAGELRVSIDGEVRPAAVVGQPVPVDPGVHRIVVRGPHGAARGEARVDGDQKTVTIDIELPAAPPPPSIPRGLATRKKVALGVAGVGALALAAGAGFGVSTVRTWSRARDEHCDAELRCDPEGIALNQRARRHGTISTVAFATAGVALAAATILWLTGDSGPERSGDGVAPWAGPTGAGVAWLGHY